MLKSLVLSCTLLLSTLSYVIGLFQRFGTGATGGADIVTDSRGTGSFADIVIETIIPTRSGFGNLDQSGAGANFLNSAGSKV